MGNMEGFGIFLWNAVITLFSFLAVAPIVLSAYRSALPRP